MPTTTAQPGKVSQSPLAVFQRNAVTRRLIHHRFGTEPEERAMAALAAVCGRAPRWVQAETLPADLLFLHDMARCARARRVVEIGVASGLSTSIILHALASGGSPLKDSAGRTAVQSVDILEHVPWDKGTRIGAAIPEVVPDLAHGVTIHTRKTALNIPEIVEPGGADFAFVDGAHSHPWPALDVLMLSRVLRPGSWIVLHDIALAERALIAARALNLDSVDFGARGAEYLFEFWPGEKIRGVGDCWNIGAIRVPPDGSFRPEHLRDLLAVPWETGLVLPAIEALHAMIGKASVFIGANLHRPEQRLPAHDGVAALGGPPG